MPLPSCRESPSAPALIRAPLRYQNSNILGNFAQNQFQPPLCAQSKVSFLQPMWDAIVNFDPQLFIWLGDNVYGDNRRPFRVFGKERTIGPWRNVPRFYPSTEEELKRRYDIAKANPGYTALRRKAKVT